MNKICVVGLGYIGLPTSAILALSGYQVIGVDVNEKVVETINKGKIHINEPKLYDIVENMVAKKRLVAKKKPEKADAFIISVPTPLDKNRNCDLSSVKTAIKSIIPYIEKENVIIIESTIPPCTVENIIKPIIEKAGFNVGKDIYLAYCPERVLPGKIMDELVNNNRIVGGCTSICAKKAAEIYKPFIKGEILITDARTAEMTKLIENTFRDVNIALVNELVKICNKLQINVLEVIKLANKHPRVNLHLPGPGVGGHCLAVDPYFIIQKAPELAKIISLAREINSSMPYFIVSQVKQLTKNINTPKIAVFGIAYKGNIDDIRESPALEIIKLLKNEGFTVTTYDPYVKTDIITISTIDQSIKNADMILILADHNEFKNINYVKLAKQMRTPIIFDTKNVIKRINNNFKKIKIINLGNLFRID